MKKDQSFGLVVFKKLALEEQPNIKDREVLVVKHKSGNHRGLPKGHPEGKETPQETAIREVFEETGIVIKPDQVVGSTSFQERYQFFAPWRNQKVDKTVTYFLAFGETEAQASTKNSFYIQDSEVLDAQWLTISDAINHVTHHDNARILQEAIDYIQNQ